MGDTEAKQFLYTWLGKNNMSAPSYNVRPSGPKHRQRFLCELRVKECAYTACGNSTSKKDAQTNAAKDFLAYLVRQGKLGPSELPQGIEESPTAAAAATGGSMFQSGFGPQSLGHAYHRRDEGGEGGSSRNQEEIYRQRLDEANKRRVEEAEDADVNAAIHGNWTVENAKSMLHGWMQTNKLKADYRYSNVGPDHSRSFVAEMGFFVKELNRPIHARETGSNKQSASKSCALSLVRQLFHLGVIEAFTGSLKKNRDVENMKPYDVCLSPELTTQLEDCLKSSGLAAVSIPAAAAAEGASEEPLSLVTDSQTALMPDQQEAAATESHGVVSWCPPIQNWNPWTGCNIDDGPIAGATLEQIGDDLYREWSERRKVDRQLESRMAERTKLPIFGMREEIIGAVRENQVVLIRGATGQ